MSAVRKPVFLTVQVLITLALALPIAPAQQTVGLFLNDPASFQGYTLFAPTSYTSTYLIDNQGLIVNSWTSGAPPGMSAYLLENGHLLRTVQLPNTYFHNAGGLGGGIREWDWDGTLVWWYNYTNSQHCQHHDVEKLPNGNVLLIAWEKKTQSQALNAGRKSDLVTTNGLWPDHIIEVKPSGGGSGTIVWEWHLWDHLIQNHDPTKANYGVVADHPELVDINYTSRGSDPDWIHTNSIRYNADLDQILLSSRYLCEIWVIDHSTTTAEAAGHTGGNSGKGGDLLYRWGNPQVYQRGTAADKKLFDQHDAQWIETGRPGAGDILIFNNGWYRTGGSYSSIDQITPPLEADGNYHIEAGSAYGPTALTWTYTATPPSDWYADHISGAQRQPNGNTLICDGPAGTFFEVTPDGVEVWNYVNPVTGSGPVEQGETPGPGGNMVFKIRRYPPDYPGLAGRTLIPGCTVEIDDCYPVLRLALDDPNQSPTMLPLDPERDLYTSVGASPVTFPGEASPSAPPLIYYEVPDATLLLVIRSGNDIILNFSF